MNRFEAPAHVRDAEHSIVYRNDREFCGWPFICGFWTTAEGHHLVAFQKKPCAYTIRATCTTTRWRRSARRSSPCARATTRAAGTPGTSQVLYDLGADQDAIFAAGPQDYSSEPRLDFTDPNVLVASGATPDYFRPHSQAWIRVSTDGGRIVAAPDPGAQGGTAVAVGARVGRRSGPTASASSS